MRKFAVGLGLLLAFQISGAWGQEKSSAVPSVTQGDVYCSGFITTNALPRSVRIVSGEDSTRKISFSYGDYVYINKGSDENVKPGDVFLVMRPIHDEWGVSWFKGQSGLLRAMGQAWADEGRLKVVVAHPKMSVAIVSAACNYLQRGDIVVPFVKRPVPQLKSEDNFDRFAPPSGKPKATVVATKGFGIQAGTSDIIYVNLGSAQGVKVGDYFRIFRYQENGKELVYQSPNMATAVYGFGAAPHPYSGKDMPRQIVGEGVVLRTGPNASTVLITYSLEAIYDGDYCELE